MGVIQIRSLYIRSNRGRAPKRGASGGIYISYHIIIEAGRREEERAVVAHPLLPRRLGLAAELVAKHLSQKVKASRRRHGDARSLSSRPPHPVGGARQPVRARAARRRRQRRDEPPPSCHEARELGGVLAHRAVAHVVRGGTEEEEKKRVSRKCLGSAKEVSRKCRRGGECRRRRRPIRSSRAAAGCASRRRRSR